MRVWQIDSNSGSCSTSHRSIYFSHFIKMLKDQCTLYAFRKMCSWLKNMIHSLQRNCDVSFSFSCILLIHAHSQEWGLLQLWVNEAICVSKYKSGFYLLSVTQREMKAKSSTFLHWYSLLLLMKLFCYSTWLLGASFSPCALSVDVSMPLVCLVLHPLITFSSSSCSFCPKYFFFRTPNLS